MPNLIIIIAVLGALAFIAWRRLDLALAVLPLLFPAYLIRTQIFFIPSTLLELSLYLLFIIWIVRGKKRKISFEAYNIPLVLLAFSVILSTIISFHFKVSLGIAKAWFFDPLLYFFLILQVIKSVRQVFFFFFSLVISGLLVSVIGIVQAVLGEFTYDGRIASIYEGVPNYLALYLAPILVLAVVLFFKLPKDQSLFLKFGLGLGIVVMLQALFLSMSLGGFLAVAICLLIFFFFLPRRSQWFMFGTFLLAAVFFLIFQISSPKWQQFIAGEEPSSLQARWQIWRTSLAILSDHWLLGVGLGQFEPIYQKYLPHYFFPPLEWVVREPHNLFLSFWLNLGILGLTAFLALLCVFFNQAVRLLRNKKISPEIKSFLFASLFGMIAILIHGLVDVPYWKNDLAFVFWLFIAITEVLKNTLHSKS